MYTWKTFRTYQAVTKTWQLCPDVFFLPFPCPLSHAHAHTRKNIAGSRDYIHVHVLYMHTRTHMGHTCIHVYACTVAHVCTCMQLYTCMHVRYMYGPCVYVYVCTVRVYTCMDVCYMCLRVCMYGTYEKFFKWYGNGKKINLIFPHTNRQNMLTGVLLGLRAAKVDKGGQECGDKGSAKGG